MFTRIIAAMTVVSILLLGVLLFTTSPSKIGPLGILFFFVLMYLSALGVLTFFIWGSCALLSKATGKGDRPQFKKPSLRQSYYRGSVIALVPFMLIAMYTVGSIGVYQILLIFTFVVIAWIYVTNRTS